VECNWSTKIEAVCYVRKCGYGQVQHEYEILVEVHELNSAVRFRREIWKGGCIDSRPCILREGRRQIQRNV